MKWLLCWLILTLKSHNFISGRNDCKKKEKLELEHILSCKEEIHGLVKKGNRSNIIKALMNLEQILEEFEDTESTSVSIPGQMVATWYKPKGSFKGLEIHASEKEAKSDGPVSNSKVRVHLPRELDARPGNTIVFCMLSMSETNRTIWGDSHELYESRLVGLSVRGKNISGLRERVNITTILTMDINETQTPSCIFFDFTTQEISKEGCLTLWERGWSHITCSCDHLTYFGVLMVSTSIPPPDLENISYITLIGCSISLLALVLTVVLFITNRKLRADVSMKVHINLAIALILLNVHFLPSQAVAAMSSTNLCRYMALSLHYSLLATFSWMGLEGFHLYLLLVRVFNIYIRRYLLKLSVVGWGIPAVIVSLVFIIDRDTYGHVSVGSSNSTTICYIGNNIVKMVTTVGLFGMVFIFNVIMLGVMVRRLVSLRQSKKFGQMECDRTKRDMCTLLGVIVLLGITWGLIFFSFGSLTVPVHYLFSILNSVQGLFIFLWFVMSLRKTGNSAAPTRSETSSTS